MTRKPTYEELEKRIQELEQSESERKQAEEKLQESEERYKALFMNMGSGVAIYEVKGDGEDFIFTDFNKAAEKIDNQKKEELIGRSIFEARPQVEEFGLIDVFREVWKTGKPNHFPITLYQDEKLKSWYENFIYKLPSGEIVSISTDETDRNRAEKTLKYSQLQLEAILNNLDASIYIADMDSHEMLFMNNHMKELFGKDLTGEICWKFLHENQSGPCYFCTNDRLIDVDGNPSKPYVWETYNQKLRNWYELHDQAIPWTDGRLVRMEISFDITDQKKLQEEVLRSRKLESIGTLAGGIAHDFNNLLYVVMGNISLAKDDLKPEIGTSESLKVAEQACIKAKKLSARLITFSKGGDPVKETMSIDNLLKDAVISALKGFNIKSNISIADGIIQVNIDEDQIKQVVHNIAVNAREAMDDNGRLKVSCENIDIAEKGYLTLSQGKYIKISFKDQGGGISKENLNKIFDPYFSTKDMGADKGQGLGLTISYSIIEKHGGLITVESELETGSTVSVYLPAAPVKEPDLQKSRGRSAAKEHVKQTGTSTGKILLMDDQEEVRTFLGQVINRLGYDVETCTEGKEAVQIYKKAMESKEAFDVAILDLTNKFGMGGQETMKRLLEIDDTARGIVITGYSDDPVVANFRAYGFSGFITKPATRNEMSKVIHEVISKDHF